MVSGIVRRFSLFSVCLISFHCAVCLGDDDRWFGPLPFTEPNPLYTFWITPTAEAASVLAPGKWSFNLNQAYANAFEVRANQRFQQNIDLELWTQTLALQYGFKDGWEAGFQQPFRSYFGGFLDAFIQDFHAALGLPNDDRDLVANGAFSFSLTETGNETAIYQLSKQSFEPGDVSVWVKRGWETGSLSLALKGVLKFPTGSSLLSSGGTDGSLQLFVSKKFSRGTFHGGVGFIALDRGSEAREITQRSALWFSHSYEHRLKESLAIIVQIDGSTAYFRDTGLRSLDRIPLSGTLGLAGRLGKWVWHWGFSEDLLAEGPSLDFTVSLNLNRVF